MNITTDYMLEEIERLKKEYEKEKQLLIQIEKNIKDTEINYEI